MVGEEYMIANKTQPPLAFYRADGSFDFTLPDGADFNQASAWGASGMPVVQGTIDKGKNKMAIAFPFRPGESGVRLSYKVPYAGNHVTLHNVSPYSSERLIIAAPPTVQISGAGITAAGQDQGFQRLHARQRRRQRARSKSTSPEQRPCLPRNKAAVVAGAVPALPPAADDSQNPSVNSRADDGVGRCTFGKRHHDSRAPRQPEVDSHRRIRFHLHPRLRLSLAASATGRHCRRRMDHRSRRPELRAPRKNPQRVPRSSPQPYASAAAPAPAAAGSAAVATEASRGAVETIADVDNQVQGSLDDLKNNIFRLELRRQAGTISEEDYTRERARVEKALRDLVQG